jgi:3',5'-cyclic AMP phosphodiesterase CpdA
MQKRCAAAEATVAAALLLGACASGGAAQDPGQHTLLVVADPQLHNIHGLSLKQMAPAADFVSGVAIRPPELNILAPLVFDQALQKGLKNDPDVLLVLGDVANIGCSGEVEQFYGVVQGQAGRLPPVIMAHGNHDTYLMGTLNTYFPMDDAEGWKPATMQASAVPTDESWWDQPGPTTSLAKPGWRDGCYHPGTASAPMNKSRWLAKYMASLERWGAVARPGSAAGTAVPLTIEATPGSALAGLNYRAEGMWHRPAFRARPSESDFNAAYRSYIVQRFDLGKTSTVVIDTSVCENARSITMPVTNAGTWACIGAEQLDTIARMVREVPPDHRLVLASHFPIRGLALGVVEHLALLKVLNERGSWTYLSAHTHDGKTDKKHSRGHEINMGSTTDWPMEWNLVRYPAGPARPWADTFLNPNPGRIAYVRARDLDDRFEVCRHLAAAEKLAKLDLAAPLTSWQSPPADVQCKVASRKDWVEQSRRLDEQIGEIHRRYREDKNGYRDRLLAIAAAASEAESHTFSLIK